MRGNFIYGFPDIDGSGVKAADEFAGPGIDPDTLDTRVPESDSARMYRENIAGRFNGVLPQRRNAMACLYTLTPDHHFIIDEHPDADRILVVSPCSGHGFKHSAAIGEVAARRVAGMPTIDVSAFAVSRFVSAWWHDLVVRQAPHEGYERQPDLPRGPHPTARR